MTVQITVRLLGGSNFDPIEVVLDPPSAAPTKLTSRSASPVRDLTFSFASPPESIEVFVKVPQPEWARDTWSPGATEKVRQALRLVSNRPLAYAPAPDEAPHPRLVSATHASPQRPRGSTNPNATIITIDLRFLPVTDFLVKLRKDMLGALDDQSPNTLRRRSAANNYFVNTKMRPAAGRVRFFECTVATPRLWAVAYHVDTPKRLPLHLAYFLIPKTPEYQEGNQIKLHLLGNNSLDSLQRYLLSPPLNRPFFVRNKLNDSDLKNDIRHHDWGTDIPECGFIEQIVKTPSCALVLPLPNGNAVRTHYGNLTSGPLARTGAGGTTVDTSLAGLSRGLRRAIVAAADLRRNLVGSTMRGMRIALGGFSVGAIDAASVLNLNKDSVTEFYWFDPSTDVITNQRGIVQNWLTMGSDRLVRLIGGSQYTALENLHAQLLGSVGNDDKRVTIIPKPGFFNPSNADRTYVSAVAAPVHAGMTSPEEFTGPGEPPSALTKLTETVLVSSSLLELIRRGTTEELACHAFEAAGVLRFKWCKPMIAEEKAKTPPPTPPGDLNDEDYKEALRAWERTIVELMNARWTLAEFAQFMDGPPGEPGKGFQATIRHQWTVCGGQSDPGRGDSFEGHLEQCLAKGKLV